MVVIFIILWLFGKKLQKNRANQKKIFKKQKIIIFSFKLYPFIPKENKSKYLDELYNYSSSIDNIFNKFIEYFKKNWENSFFLDFDILPNGDILNRTNYVVESFHNKINKAVEFKLVPGNRPLFGFFASNDFCIS